MMWGLLGIAVVLVIAAAVALLRRGGGTRSTKRGMKQFARDPARMRRMTNVFAQREALLARAAEMSDAELREGAEQLLSGDANTRSTWQQVLEKAGRRSEPALLALLSDPRCKPSAEPAAPMEQHRFDQVVQSLARIGSDRVLALLVPLLDSPEKRLRKQAAMNIATVGSAAATGPTLRSLADADSDVRSYAHLGCGWGLRKANASPEFRRAIAEALRPVVAGETSHNTFDDHKAAETLVAVDRTGAAEWLASPRCLRLENPHLADVLPALNAIGAKADAALLRRIHDAAAARTEHPWPNIRAEAFGALARMDPASVRSEIDAALADPDATVRRGGVDALRHVHGLPDPWDFYGHGVEFEAMPRPVQHIIAAIEFEAEVNNGGVSQYFFNSAGDHWPVALEGFRAIECAALTDILKTATGVLGPSGPSLDRSQRIKQYAKISDEVEKGTLDALSSQFYKDPDHLNVRMARYMVKHAEVMREMARQVKKPER